VTLSDHLKPSQLLLQCSSKDKTFMLAWQESHSELITLKLPEVAFLSQLS
jgi:hypothetical protein